MNKAYIKKELELSTMSNTAIANYVAKAYKVPMSLLEKTVEIDSADERSRTIFFLAFLEFLDANNIAHSEDTIESLCDEYIAPFFHTAIALTLEDEHAQHAEHTAHKPPVTDNHDH